MSYHTVPMLPRNQLVVGSRVSPWHAHQSLIASNKENNSCQIWHDWLWWLSLVLVYILHTCAFLRETEIDPLYLPRNVLGSFLEIDPLYSPRNVLGSLFLVSLALTRARYQNPSINPESTLCVDSKSWGNWLRFRPDHSDLAHKLPLKNNPLHPMTQYMR